jgi:cell division protein FtsB
MTSEQMMSNSILNNLAQRAGTDAVALAQARAQVDVLQYELQQAQARNVEQKAEIDRLSAKIIELVPPPAEAAKANDTKKAA